MCEAEHEAARLVAHVEKPTHLETVQALEDDAEREKDAERPPTEAQVFVGGIHSARIILRLLRWSSSRSNTSCRNMPVESRIVCVRYVVVGVRTSNHHFLYAVSS